MAAWRRVGGRRLRMAGRAALIEVLGIPNMWGSWLLLVSRNAGARIIIAEFAPDRSRLGRTP
jgi:hypothetical protein